MKCPYCHSEKPLAAPVCSECNHDTPLMFTIFFNIASAMLTMGLFVGVIYLFLWLF